MSTTTATQAIDGSISLSNRLRQPERMQSDALQIAHELKDRAQGLVDALEGPTDTNRDLAILEAQANVRSSARELERLTIQPSDFLFQLSVSQQLFVCVHWLCHFKVVFHVPMGSGDFISYADLACKADVPFGTMRSVIRMAMIYGVPPRGIGRSPATYTTLLLFRNRSQYLQLDDVHGQRDCPHRGTLRQGI